MGFGAAKADRIDEECMHENHAPLGVGWLKAEAYPALQLHGRWNVSTEKRATEVDRGRE